MSMFFMGYMCKPEQVDKACTGWAKPLTEPWMREARLPMGNAMRPSYMPRDWEPPGDAATFREAMESLEACSIWTAEIDARPIGESVFEKPFFRATRSRHGGHDVHELSWEDVKGSEYLSSCVLEGFDFQQKSAE